MDASDVLVTVSALITGRRLCANARFTAAVRARGLRALGLHDDTLFNELMSPSHTLHATDARSRVPVPKYEPPRTESYD